MNNVINADYGNPITEEMKALKNSSELIQDICVAQIEKISHLMLSYMNNVLDIHSRDISTQVNKDSNTISFYKESKKESILVISFTYEFDFSSGTEIGFTFDVKTYNDYKLDAEYFNDAMGSN